MTAAAPLDLRRYACPITYVKTLIALEKIAPGGRLELWLSAGEPVESVPRTAAEEGHRVVCVEPLEDHPGAYRVVLEKRAARPEVLP
jgi:TusA-related sulfurtransferase